MLTTLATWTVVTLAAQQTDTTVPVRQGARLEVNNLGGGITVTTWSRSAVRIAANHSSRDRIEITVTDLAVRAKAEGQRGHAQVVDYEITVPAWMALNLSGVHTDIRVEGTQAEVSAETVQGEVHVTGGSGNVSLKSVEGSVTLANARGRIDLHSVNDDITATDVSGDITAETVDGDITFLKIESSNAEANTVDGDVTYDGTIKDGGRYRFATHDGTLRVSVPENANVRVSVGTLNGEFLACYPVQLTGQRGHRFNYTMGSGSARLELESFDGDIEICRPGEVSRTKRERKGKE